MTSMPKNAARLQFLIRVVARECAHLGTTDTRLFAEPFVSEKVERLANDPDCAERLGFIESTEMWLTMRQLRNQMVHEYIEDPVVLANALQVGHEFVPRLVKAADTMAAEIRRRGWHRP